MTDQPLDRDADLAVLTDVELEDFARALVAEVKRLRIEIATLRTAGLPVSTLAARQAFEQDMQTIQRLRADRDAALAAGERVRALHRQQLNPWFPDQGECARCCTPWPCDTARALDPGAEQDPQR